MRRSKAPSATASAWTAAAPAMIGWPLGACSSSASSARMVPPMVLGERRDRGHRPPTARPPRTRLRAGRGGSPPAASRRASSNGTPRRPLEAVPAVRRRHWQAPPDGRAGRRPRHAPARTGPSTTPSCTGIAANRHRRALRIRNRHVIAKTGRRRRSREGPGVSRRRPSPVDDHGQEVVGALHRALDCLAKSTLAGYQSYAKNTSIQRSGRCRSPPCRVTTSQSGRRRWPAPASRARRSRTNMGPVYELALAW